jgi:hypothetical protein
MPKWYGLQGLIIIIATKLKKSPARVFQEARSSPHRAGCAAVDHSPAAGSPGSARLDINDLCKGTTRLVSLGSEHLAALVNRPGCDGRRARLQRLLPNNAQTSQASTHVYMRQESAYRTLLPQGTYRQDIVDCPAGTS